jgi:two-component sensor histidine kinase
VVIRALPLLEHGRAVGAVVVLRDVTDLRRRDRMLLSKDATIREIHHRVKNNLQTIAALLRLQRRRVKSPEALQAIEESERRIRSIAIVHETLSKDTTDAVRLVEIAQLLVRQVEETVASEDVHVNIELRGDAGEVPGDLATPLAVVLNELLQNAVEHGFPVGDGGRVDGKVTVGFSRGDEELLVEVSDDGVGLPPGFSLDASRGLGLSIVQALVTTELGGSMEMTRAAGTRVELRVPLPRT